MKRLWVLEILMLLLMSTTASAGVADLALEINPDNFNNLNTGGVGEFEIIVTNNGPDEAGVSSPINFPISINTEILFDDGTFNIGFVIDDSIPQDCQFIPTVIEPRPGNPPGIVYSFFIDTIPVSTSVSCFGRFQVFGENFANSVEWRIINPSDTDPDESNNRVYMSFFGTVVSVPALNMISLTLLALVIQLYSWIKFKRVT